MTTIIDDCFCVDSSDSQHSSSNSRRTSLTEPLSPSNSTSSHASLSHRPVRRRQVSFVSVDIIELSIELGDHPACRSGPSLQTTGRVERRVCMGIEDYEEERLPLRRSLQDLCLSSADRKRLLRLFSKNSDDRGDDDRNEIGSSRSMNSFPARPLKYTEASHVHEAERRIHAMDNRVDSLMERMDSLDRVMADLGRKRQQRQRAKRAAMVHLRTSL